MNRRLPASRHYYGGFPSQETSIVEVREGTVTLAFDDGDRIQFDAQELAAEIEHQLLAERRENP